MALGRQDLDAHHHYAPRPGPGTPAPLAGMSGATLDAGLGAALSDAEEARLQLAGYLSCALSVAGTLYVLAHFGCGKPRRQDAAAQAQLPQQYRRRGPRARMDFMDKLVLVLALFDLVTVAARAVGRSVIHDRALCRTQAAVIQAANLASCSWICCMAYNLYRWIAGGESDATRQRRFPLFLAIAVVPGAGFVVFHLMTNKYGDATFYCWLDEIRYMFLNFYLFYLLMIVFNFVLLALIHFNMKQRVARHDTVEADTSSMLIRRKLLLYIVVFIVHRTPMMIYRIFEAGGLESVNVGLAMQVIQDLNGFSNSIVYGGICRRRTKDAPLPRDCEAESVSSPTESIAGGYVVKKRTTDDNEAVVCASARIGTALTQSGRKVSYESDSGDSNPSRNTHSRKAFGIQDEHSYTYRSWQQRLQKRFSLHHAPPPPPVEPKKIAIFASTFNMGEKDVHEHELRDWIPLGQDVYVIGVQECMDLADLQIKILRHLVSGSTSKYVHYSREIGKRATALGYHGYIALCIFVRATAVASGRFRMPHRQSSNKNAQEVFRGKSLLLFGRASNKGAVGMSFRFDDTSFAFVTCHLASDSSSLKRAKRKKSSNSVLKGGNGDSSGDLSLLNHGGSVARSSGGDSGGNKASVSEEATMEAHQPPSKVQRRNQDAMEILQQLYLDEEDYGFGFSQLHHHSFILGDFNYRMTRKGATPIEMLELLVNAGTEQHHTPEDIYTMCLSSPCSPAMLQTSRSEQSPQMDEGDFRQCVTPKVQSPTPIVTARRSHRYVRARTGTAASNSGSSSAPFLLRTLVEEHDELYQLCRSQQIFHGFQENEINFFPTFRRIRGKALREPLDADTFQQNYSLVATHGGYRVPSYTDRVFYSSLVGMQDSLRCLSYDSCEAVTSSDHKPVSACFEVALLASQKTSSASLLAEDALWNANSTDANPMILRAEGAFAASRMKDVPGACELRLRIEFRSIHWIDAVDSALFDRAEHVQFGFLFPLPCEDVFAPQRKLHEVAEHLTFGGSESTNTGGMGFASTITPTSNFHTLKWHEFVNGGLRYHTLAGGMGRKHVAVMLRSLSRGRSMSKISSASRLLGGSCSPSPHTSVTSIASTCSPTPHGSSVGSSSSFSSEMHFGHGTFCAEGMAKKREVCVPLTLGGRLLGRLQLRVSLQMRQKK